MLSERAKLHGLQSFAASILSGAYVNTLHHTTPDGAVLRKPDIDLGIMHIIAQDLADDASIRALATYVLAIMPI